MSYQKLEFEPPMAVWPCGLMNKNMHYVCTMNTLVRFGGRLSVRIANVPEKKIDAINIYGNIGDTCERA